MYVLLLSMMLAVDNVCSVYICSVDSGMCVSLISDIVTTSSYVSENVYDCYVSHASE